MYICEVELGAVHMKLLKKVEKTIMHNLGEGQVTSDKEQEMCESTKKVV